MLESWITNNCHAALSWARRPEFPWDCLRQCARAALLGLPPSLMHRDPIQGGTHVPSTQIGGGSSPQVCATQNLVWSCAAEPGASSRHGTWAVAGCLQVHLPRVLGSMGNGSPEASCVLSPTPPIPKHWWHQDRAGKGEPCWYLVPFQPLLVQPAQTAVPGC